MIEFSISQGTKSVGARGGVSGRTEEVEIAGAGGVGEVTILPGVGETPAIEAATVWTPCVKHIECFRMECRLWLFLYLNPVQLIGYKRMNAPYLAVRPFVFCILRYDKENLSGLI